MKKPNFKTLALIKTGVIEGLENTQKKLKKEMFLNTPFDTGYLRDGAVFGSGEGNEMKRKDLTLRIKNEAFYAPYVYYESRTSHNKIRRGRPWIEEAIDKVDPTRLIQEAVNNVLSQK